MAMSPGIRAIILAVVNRHDMNTIAGRERACAAFVRWLRLVPDPEMRDLYTSYVSRATGVRIDVLREVLRTP